MPTRKVTPKSMSSSTNWSSVSGIVSGSDAENMSPSGARAGSVKVEKRRSSGILQEIGNATLTRPKKARPRVTSGRVFGPEAGQYDGVYADSPTSPPPPKTSTIKPRSVKTRAKVAQKRRSVSGEARMYIDHLEAELASAQAQLSIMNSPTVTREQSSKMRTLNAETRQLQDDLAEWEAKYEQRVQEEVDKHCEIESSLRSVIRKLEQDAEETKYRVQELENELESTVQHTEVAEAANVNLEKRLEIMSDLLATSPTKIDLHAEVPGMRRRHQRPKSMLPRFPTASSLVASPERQPRTQPTSPMYTFNNMSPVIPESLDNSQLALDTSFSHSEIASDAESVFSAAPLDGDSMTSLEHPDGMPNFNQWTMHAVQNARARPARRMRRFGAGSLGPKPLILPSTSHCEQIPASAPLLERSETTPAFSFPGTEDLPEEDNSPSSSLLRRRASTSVDETTLANLAASPFLQLPRTSEVGEDSMLLGVRCPASAESQQTMRDFSSLGSAVGRNLMDELCAVRTHDTVESGEEASRVILGLSNHSDSTEDATIMYGEAVEEGVDVHSVLSAEHASSPPTQGAMSSSTTAIGPHTRSTSSSRSTSHGLSAWDRLRILFGEVWRSPAAMARHFVQTAQARMRVPDPLRNVQWWLVGVLLGPMAKRRLLVSPACCASDRDLENQPLLEASSPPDKDEGGLVYGTVYDTPSTSPSGRSNQTISGKGKKRAGVGKPCPHHHRQHRSKHSPWLWLKFSITLAFAVGVAFKDGPASLLRGTVCGCKRKGSAINEGEESRQVSATLC